MTREEAKAVMEVRFKKFRNRTRIGFTTEMTGKMLGMCSLSTSPLVNPRCPDRAKDPESVCNRCFSMAAMEYQKNCAEKFGTNGNVLSNYVIPINKWPVILKSAYPEIRLEAFGDVINAIHVINYFNLCKQNPKITFTAWTKNVDFYEAAVKMGHEKPDNLILVASSPMLNTEINVENHPIVDKTFTVYTLEYIEANNIGPNFINCGARSCKKCGRCYRKADDVENVREILKQDARKVQKFWEKQR